MNDSAEAAWTGEARGTNECILFCYGLEVRVVDAVGAGLCSRLREAYPQELASFSGASVASVSYRVNERMPSTVAQSSGYSITRDDVHAFDGSTEEEVLQWLQQNIDETVSRNSRDRLFVHAGVVGWRGLAILVVGRSFTGKSTLVAELVRRGAAYYSDEYAVVDDEGRVYPYARPLILRDCENRRPLDLRLEREGVQKEPLKIALIVAAAYRPGVTWRPSVVCGAQAVLPLIDGTVLAREESEKTLRIAAHIAPTVVTLRGTRPDATEVAPRLLDLIDDALVSQALNPGGESANMAAQLAAVARLRLGSQIGRPSPHRQLRTARYFRLTDFLSAEDHQRMIDLALSHQDAFQESGIVGNDGGDRKDYGVRRSRTLYGPYVENVWSLFDQRLRQILPHVRTELGLQWFPLGQIERQLTAHTGGGFFAPHVDTGHPSVANRRISCVYYFHSTPRRFTGGELKLYDTWVTSGKTTAAATFETLTPLNNSLLFFASETFHEVCPVQRETEEFGDSRFAVTIWFREGEWPNWGRGATDDSNRL